MLGIDPGAKQTGLVVVERPDSDAERLLDHQVFERHDGEGVLVYGRRLLGRVYGLREAAWTDDPHVAPLVAVETLVAVVPHLGTVQVDHQREVGIILGMVAGWLLAASAPWVPVRPGRHGKHPLTTYPAALIGPREKGPYPSQSNPLRHCKSALDIARQGPRLWRLQQQGAA